MKISKERLEKEAESTGFRPEVLEKVIHLMDLLNAFKLDPFVSKRIVLKGGTALNLFYYDLPRLSVDIDINYIGSADKAIMLSERNELIGKMETIMLRKYYISQNKPSEHAGGKWRLHYQSDLQGNPRLELDLNFLARQPLWEISYQNSIILGSYVVEEFPVLDKHELAAGKLTALFSRHASRDLFDTHQILVDKDFDLEKLRLAFIVYGGASRVDWREISIDNIDYESAELKNKLIPVLRQKDLLLLKDSKQWANTLVKDCKEKLTMLLPFRDKELEFLTALLDFGEIKPELLTENSKLQRKIKTQPGLLWKAVNVKKHKNL